MVGGRESEPYARIDCGRLKAIEGLVQSGGDHAVVRCGEAGGDTVIAGVEAREAVSLAHRVRVMFDANAGGDLEVRRELPLILCVKAKIVNGDGSRYRSSRRN